VVAGGHGQRSYHNGGMMEPVTNSKANSTTPKAALRQSQIHLPRASPSSWLWDAPVETNDCSVGWRRGSSGPRASHVEHACDSCKMTMGHRGHWQGQARMAHRGVQAPRPTTADKTRGGRRNKERNTARSGQHTGHLETELDSSRFNTAATVVFATARYANKRSIARCQSDCGAFR